ncbi:YggS family pyridoxal phosphate-dependent enzyme [Pseudonocardia sp. KRD291]|uniref:YggS family pyridoxal phosphate-dependent enzyme n=1 Tax=Pseudonocardia sp. KRD291 TaxID=2792007 RepID=UPI001C49EA78|nr:YggS family pyridoxal phosphate-dependent enzyme [Pseudonocardia sp. KRD291]MBW0102609.1 YggS family pyridoxal phosphate-dependent enzyme [Pseudonocardia sp. KRD291]
MDEPEGPDRRRDELARNLAAVRERIDAACAAAGRERDSVSLVAVTKTVPASDVATLLDLGVTDLGENRAQEAGTKAGEVAGLRPDASPRWYFVGGLQRNKVRLVLPWVTRVESVDSPRLARALDRAASAAVEDGSRDGPLPVLLQYSVDGDLERGGVSDEGLAELADLVAGLPGLRLDGLMAVAPLGSESDRAFAAIAGAAGRLRAAHPGATEVSAGMSGDLETAVGHGSTVVRVGTALVGDRRITSR